eukprot:3530-Heterococcus_DN1.PRE.9
MERSLNHLLIHLVLRVLSYSAHYLYTSENSDETIQQQYYSISSERQCTVSVRSTDLQCQFTVPVHSASSQYQLQYQLMVYSVCACIMLIHDTAVSTTYILRSSMTTAFGEAHMASDTVSRSAAAVLRLCDVHEDAHSNTILLTAHGSAVVCIIMYYTTAAATAAATAGAAVAIVIQPAVVSQCAAQHDQQQQQQLQPHSMCETAVSHITDCSSSSSKCFTSTCKRRSLAHIDMDVVIHTHYHTSHHPILASTVAAAAAT